jgi:hypothetical protein
MLFIVTMLVFMKLLFVLPLKATVSEHKDIIRITDLNTTEAR